MVLVILVIVLVVFITVVWVTFHACAQTVSSGAYSPLFPLSTVAASLCIALPSSAAARLHLPIAL